MCACQRRQTCARVSLWNPPTLQQAPQEAGVLRAMQNNKRTRDCAAGRRESPAARPQQHRQQCRASHPDHNRRAPCWALHTCAVLGCVSRANAHHGKSTTPQKHSDASRSDASSGRCCYQHTRASRPSDAAAGAPCTMQLPMRATTLSQVSFTAPARESCGVHHGTQRTHIGRHAKTSTNKTDHAHTQLLWVGSLSKSLTGGASKMLDEH